MNTFIVFTQYCNELFVCKRKQTSSVEISLSIIYRRPCFLASFSLQTEQPHHDPHETQHLWIKRVTWSVLDGYFLTRKTFGWVDDPVKSDQCSPIGGGGPEPLLLQFKTFSTSELVYSLAIKIFFF